MVDPLQQERIPGRVIGRSAKGAGGRRRSLSADFQSMEAAFGQFGPDRAAGAVTDDEETIINFALTEDNGSGMYRKRINVRPTGEREEEISVLCVMCYVLCIVCCVLCAVSCV